MKGRLGLLISIGAGVFAVIAMMLYLNARERSLMDQAAPQDVVVTTQNVLANTALDERFIQVVKVPRKYVQPGALRSPQEVVGRVSAVPLLPGSQILGTTLLEGGRESLSFNVPRGMRVIAIAVNDITGVGGELRPRNVVDLIGVFEYGVPSGSQGGQITYAQERTEAITIAQNVQIMSVGMDPRALAEQAQAAAEKGKDAPMPNAAPPPPAGAITNVCLLVTPQQVQEIILAQQIGTMTLSLRSSLDLAPVDLPRLDENTFLKIPMPMKPKSGPSWREMRGGR
jgi:pilus assembly protein CpaB